MRQRLALLTTTTLGLALLISAPAAEPAGAAHGCSITQLTDTTGFAFGPVPTLSEDGSLIAFTSGKNLTGANPDGNREVFLVAPASSAFTQLTNTTSGHFNSADIDADGSHVATEGSADPTAANGDANSEIFLITVAGPSIAQLTDTTGGTLGNINARVDDDASLVAHTTDRDLGGANADGTLEVATIEVAGPTQTPRTSSPDGVGSGFGIPNGAGTELLILSDDDLDAPGPGSGGADLFRHPLGGTYENLTDVVGLPGVESPDADDTFSRIVFHTTRDLAGDNPDGNTEVFEVTAGGKAQLTDSTGGTGSIAPVVSDDGSTVAFLSDRDPVGRNGDGNREVFLRGDDGAILQVTDTSGGNASTGGVAIDGDGSRLAFGSSADLTGANADGNLELFVADCSAPTLPTCDGQPATVLLGNGDTPTAGADVIVGTAGPDTVNALGGNDRFCGLAGNDSFFGGPGADRAIGGPGADTLRGQNGADRLTGSKGADRLIGGLQPDTLLGGSGTDTLEGGNGNDALNGGTHRDTCKGQAGRDTAAACEVRTGIP